MLFINPYIFEKGSSTPVGFGVYADTYTDIQAVYPDAETKVATIEAACGVGTPGILNINIAYSNFALTFTDNINIDTTSSASFWNDIKGWLYTNNFYDITYDSGNDQYLPDDPTHPTYLIFNTL